MLSEHDRRRVTPEHWFKPAADMRALFADLPEACDNTLAIARRCAVMAEARKPLLPVSPKVRAGQHRGGDRARHGDRGPRAPHGRDRRRCRDARALPRTAGLRTRRHRQMGFSGYFLIVADFIQWAKAQGIPVGPGRGSGAGSVAAWALTITDLDPMRFNLLFERFLNPERVSMPDFDIDFCQEGRDAVIDYVRQRIRRRPRGADHHLRQAAGARGGARCRPRARPAVRPGQQGRRTDPQQSRRKPVTLQQAIDGEPRLQQMRDEDEGVAPAAGDRAADRGAVPPRQHARRRRGHRRPAADRTGAAVPRSAIRLPGHAIFDEVRRAGGAGEVRLPRPDHADHPAARRRPCCSGLGIEVDLDRLPLDDAKTYEMLPARRCRRGVPDGRSGHARRAAPDAPRPVRGPDRRASRCIGPGPMANIPDYCRRKHGETWEAPHPEIHDILGETYGIMVYQEQVMQIAQKMARLQPGQRRPAAPRDGQEDPLGDGGAARDLHQRRDRARHRPRRRPPRSST